MGGLTYLAIDTLYTYDCNRSLHDTIEGLQILTLQHVLKYRLYYYLSMVKPIDQETTAIE